MITYYTDVLMKKAWNMISMKVILNSYLKTGILSLYQHSVSLSKTLKFVCLPDIAFIVLAIEKDCGVREMNGIRSELLGRNGYRMS